MKDQKVTTSIFGVGIFFEDEETESIVVQRTSDLPGDDDEQIQKVPHTYPEDFGVKFRLDFNFQQESFTTTYWSLRDCLGEIGGLLALYKLIVASAGIYLSLIFVYNLVNAILRRYKYEYQKMMVRQVFEYFDFIKGYQKKYEIFDQVDMDKLEKIYGDQCMIDEFNYVEIKTYLKKMLSLQRKFKFVLSQVDDEEAQTPGRNVTFTTKQAKNFKPKKEKMDKLINQRKGMNFTKVWKRL